MWPFWIKPVDQFLGPLKRQQHKHHLFSLPRLPEFIIEFTTMEPTKEQMSKMTQIGDLCVWAGLSAETPDGEGMVSPRVAFLNALDFEAGEHWRPLANMKVAAFEAALDELLVSEHSFPSQQCPKSVSFGLVS